MAKTEGHGNARWTREETILALELLFELGKQVNSKHHPKVVALSKYLRALPIHPKAARKSSFRNVDGVAFKMQNLLAVESGKGLQNVSQIDRDVWHELGDKPGLVKKIAAEIRANAGALKDFSGGKSAIIEDEEFGEGGIVYRVHRVRERHPGLRKKLLASRGKKGFLTCDCCGVADDFSATPYHAAIFEAHHNVPLASNGTAKTKTRLQDVALLCASCHRLIHRVMEVGDKWVGVSDLKKLMKSAAPLLQIAP